MVVQFYAFNYISSDGMLPPRCSFPLHCFKTQQTLGQKDPYM